MNQPTENQLSFNICNSSLAHHYKWSTAQLVLY